MTLSNPFFTIVLPSYNRARLLPAAIESIRNQEFLDWELIIVDDGSIDKTKEVVEGFIKSDSRIRYIYQDNKERSAARNKGIDNSRGKYICFLDSDDLYESDHLKLFKEEIEKSKSRFIYTLKTGDKVVNYKDKYEEVFLSMIHCQQVCICADILSKNRFREDLNICEDKELWMRIIEEENITRVNKETVRIIDHSERSVMLNNVENSIKNYKVHKELGVKYKDKLYSKLIKESVSGCLYRIGKGYLLNNNRVKAFIYFTLSMFKDLSNEQLKHRFLQSLVSLGLYK